MSGALRTLRPFGRGWWKSLANGRLMEVPHGELGPHGDHDQWIALGRHARDLGVDPVAAKAVQRSYGFFLPRSYADLARPEDLVRGRPFYQPMFDQDSELAEVAQKFYRSLYGIYPEEAFDPEAFRDLVRIRQWPKESNPFSILPMRVDRGALRTIARLPEEIPEMYNAGEIWLENPESGGHGKLSVQQLMNLRNKRDLGFRAGGRVAP